MPTITQIAQRAGVSTATVDRALHGRKGVHAQAAGRVMQAAASSGGIRGGTPTRAKKQALRFAFVLPEEHSDWVEHVERVIALVAGSERNEHAELIVLKIPTVDVSQTCEHLAGITGYDGIALMVPDAPATKYSIADLVSKGNFIVCLFTDVPGSARHLYIGSDCRAEGRTAARLICHGAKRPTEKKVLLLLRQGRMSAELERRIGFVQLLEDTFPEVEVVVKADIAGEPTASTRDIANVLAAELAAHEIFGIYCASELLAPLAASSAQQIREKHITVVAHDATHRNIQLLRDGVASYLLSQDVPYCISHAVQSLKNLRENLRGALAIVQPRIEILTAENTH